MTTLTASRLWSCERPEHARRLFPILCAGVGVGEAMEDIRCGMTN